MKLFLAHAAALFLPAAPTGRHAAPQGATPHPLVTPYAVVPARVWLAAHPEGVEPPCHAA